MTLLPGWVTRGYLRLIEPVADWLVRNQVSPNAVTTLGTCCSVAGGVIYGTGHIRTAGWFLGVTALFDVLDGMVARRTGRSSTFGAFYDSTLDRVADGFVLGGIAVFFATWRTGTGTAMVIVCLLGMIGTFVTSYTRARADALGIDVRVGLLQRPERVVLLSAPQAFFGLALGGLVLMAIIGVLTLTAWITAVQRILAVRAAVRSEPADSARAISPRPRTARLRRGLAASRSISKGE